jgi:hypothetical protein
MRFLPVVLALCGCEALDELFNPEKIGAYTCDEYCAQVLDKTEECAQAQADAECQQNADACHNFSDEDLATYASQGNPDWQGKGKEDMIDSCNTDLEEAGKSDTECQAETATLNNLSCDDILGLIGDLGG